MSRNFFGMARCVFFIPCSVALLSPSNAATVVIAENDAGESLSGSGGSLGQSFSTPEGGPWNSIQFNWFMPDGPSASGTLFLLTEEYLGSSLDLSSSTPGFLASSTDTVNGHYVFDQDVMLLPSTTYWAITNVLTTRDRRYSDDDEVPGHAYFSSRGNLTIRPLVGADVAYRVQGDVVPEPSSAALSAAAVLGLFGRYRQRRR